MSEYDDSELEVFAADGLRVPVIHMTTAGGPPSADIKVGGQGYQYDRSYPIKGHSATLPKYLIEQVAAGKQPLLIERPDRFYVYIAK